MKKINLHDAFVDKRGRIIDLVENESINAVTIVTFKKGAVRGNHYHKETFQWNYVLSGKIKLISQLQGEGILENVMEEGDFIVTTPNERHALVGMVDAKLLVLTKGPRGGKEYESDTFRLEKPLKEGTVL